MYNSLLVQQTIDSWMWTFSITKPLSFISLLHEIPFPSLLLQRLDHVFLVGKARHDHHRTARPAELRRHPVLPRNLPLTSSRNSHVDHSEVRSVLAAEGLHAPDLATTVEVPVHALLHRALVARLQRLHEELGQRGDRVVKDFDEASQGYSFITRVTCSSPMSHRCFTLEWNTPECR